MIATPSCRVISFCAAEADWSALPALSSMNSSTLYFWPPTSRSPASLISFTAISAPFLNDAPTAGMSPVSSPMPPTLMVCVPAAGAQPATPGARLAIASMTRIDGFP